MSTKLSALTLWLLKSFDLEIKVDPVLCELFVVVGWGEVLVPEVLAEEEDKDEIDDGEDGAENAEEEQRLDKQL